MPTGNSLYVEGQWLGPTTTGASLYKKNKNNGQCSTGSGTSGTYWNFDGCTCDCSSDGQSCEAYMMVDMTQPYYMSAFKYDDKSWVSSERAWKFTIESSQDGVTWTTVYTEDDARAQTVNNFVTAEWASGSARYWRWYITEGVCPTVASFDWRGEEDTGG